MTKYYEFLNGGGELPRELWITVGIYSTSAQEAQNTLLEVLFANEGEATDGSKATASDFELQSERELADDEAPTRMIYGTAPHGYTWERSY